MPLPARLEQVVIRTWNLLRGVLGPWQPMTNRSESAGCRTRNRPAVVQGGQTVSVIRVGNRWRILPVYGVPGIDGRRQGQDLTGRGGGNQPSCRGIRQHGGTERAAADEPGAIRQLLFQQEADAPLMAEFPEDPGLMQGIQRRSGSVGVAG